MSFDSSRFTFNPRNDYDGVVMQQGRVQLDSDWNEWLAENARRIQAGTVDILGRAVYPASTPYAFKITLDTANQPRIGLGRMYVDGLLVENHGPLSTQWDPVLAELSSTPPGAAEVDLPLAQQPYWPWPSTLSFPSSGTYLIYLDVWRRPVTYLEDPSLVEKAVGVDTTGRLQTAWRVNWVTAPAGVSCLTPDTSIPAWESLIQPSAARLAWRTAPSLVTPGPCCLVPTSSYTGLENQLYRVEIHQPYVPAVPAVPGGFQATFKWSRDNATVITDVIAVGPSPNQLTVQSTGKDNVLCFSPGNWIEITDDSLELTGLPGELHKIAAQGVDSVNNIITLETNVSPGFQARISTPPANYPNCHTRICRWDQGGKVFKSDGTTLVVDLDATASGPNPGQIPVPTDGSEVLLENGVVISFSAPTASGPFYTFDFWTFAARASDGSVQSLAAAPPQGLHHHYARLAIVTPPATPTDCRVAWPLSLENACGCTVTVSPAELNPENTLQDILQTFSGQTQPTTICFAPGTYSLPAPLRFPKGNVNLEACQPGTVILTAQSGQESQFVDGMVVLNGISTVTLNGLQFNMPLVPAPALSEVAGLQFTSLDFEVSGALKTMSTSIGVRAINCTALTLENCQFVFNDKALHANTSIFGVGLFASGQCSQLQVTGNTFTGGGSNFIAGFVHVPSVVTLNAPPPPVVRPIPVGVGPIPHFADLASEFRSREDQLIQTGTAMTNSAIFGGTVVPSALNEAVFKDNTFTNLTIATLLFAQSQTLEFTGNEVRRCQAGLWFLSPAQAGYVVYDPLGLALMGLSVAMGYPLPATSLQALAVPALPKSIRIYAAAPTAATVTDSNGNSWIPDASTQATAAGVSISSSPGTAVSTVALPNKIDTTNLNAANVFLYASERQGPSFQYTFQNLPLGYYTVTLRFAEIDNIPAAATPSAAAAAAPAAATTAGTGNQVQTPVRGTAIAAKLKFVPIPDPTLPSQTFNLVNLPVFHTPITFPIFIPPGAVKPPTDVGVRVFNVSINGTPFLINYDIIADAGALEPVAKVFANITPTNVTSGLGQITIAFQGTTPQSYSDANATISSIEIDGQWSGVALQQSFLEQAGTTIPNSLFVNFLTQMTQLAQQAFVSSPTVPLRLRLTDNELHCSTSLPLLLLGDDQLQNGNVSSMMMTGNRLDTTIPFSGADNTAFLTLSTQQQFLASAFLVYVYFFSTANISLVTRCVISGNLIVNNSPITAAAPFRGSFLLNDTPSPTPVITIPPPEFAIVGNVFQGNVIVSPPPPLVQSNVLTVPLPGPIPLVYLLNFFSP